MRSLLVSMCLLFTAGFAGCQLIGTAPPASPFAHQLVRDQLVFHSDFPLPADHRLVEELIIVRGRLCDKLALAATEEPIHVYLFADENKYYDFLALRFPGFPSRRAIFVETDVELSVYAHWGDRVAEDLRHEVSHGYLHAAIPNLPLWLDEGLAEYFEVGRGLRGTHRAHIDLLTAKIEVGGWRPALVRLEQIATAAEMTQEDYAEAWAWVHYLLESDDDKPALLTDYLADLRNGAAGASLSSRVQKRLAGPELALVEHLQSLR